MLGVVQLWLSSGSIGTEEPQALLVRQRFRCSPLIQSRLGLLHLALLQEKHPVIDGSLHDDVHEVGLFGLPVPADPSLGLVLDGPVPPGRKQNRSVRAGYVQALIAAFETGHLRGF